MGLATVVLILIAAECVLRVMSRPRGWFRGVFSTTQGLYPPHFDELVEIGPIPYRVTCNAHGFRGPELRTGLNAAAVRIAAVGDSVTDGYYVDNGSTFPRLLEDRLQRQGIDAEVINAGCGNVSIDRELAVLRDVVLPLSPDIVVLTFVTNDLADIAGRTPQELLSVRLEPTVQTSPVEFFATRTALGEALLDLGLRLRYRSYRLHQRQAEPRPSGSDSDAEPRPSGSAPEIDPRTDTAAAEYVAAFLDRYADTDARALAAELAPDVAAWLECYFAGFDAFADLCHTHDTRLLLVYFPAYSQVYDAQAPTTVRDRLLQHARSRGVDVLDLTPVFRAAAASRTLHFAPVDFHPNAAGNAVTAQAIAARLAELGWIDERP